jgi:hypothetical protein
VAGAPIYPELNPCTASFSASEVRPLHKVQFLFFRNPLDILVACFMNSSPNAFLSNSLVALSLLRRSCRLMPGFFSCLLPGRCCFRLRSLVSLLHSGHFQLLFPNVRLFGILGETSPSFCSLRLCPLRRATPAQRVIFLLTVSIPFSVHNFPGSEFS